MATLNDFFTFLIAGGLLMLVPIFVIAYFQAGFFLKWLRARAGRGRFILIKLRGKMRDHFTIGEIKGEWLIHGKKENTKRCLIDQKSIYRAWGVACVDIDEASNNVCSVDYQAVQGFDAEKYENLYIRTLYRPALEEDKDKILYLLVIVSIIASIIACIMGYSIIQQLNALGPVAGSVTTVV
jgi:hypothetical protein